MVKSEFPIGKSRLLIGGTILMQDIDLEYRIVGKGDITLILETGIGGSFYYWYPFIQKIKNNFNIVLYHRAGYGNSQTPNTARTTKNIAEELNELIENIGITDRFVLMGHSFGGLCAQHFAKMYPNKLLGLILLDATSHHYSRLYNLDNPIMNSLISIEQMVENNLTNSIKTPGELKEKYKQVIAKYKTILPENDRNKFEDYLTNPQLFKTIAEEFKNWGISSDQMMQLGDFPDIPLIVIARDKEVSVKSFVEYDIPEKEAVLYEDVWRDLQIELSQLSNNGSFIIADKSDHDIHLDRPDIIIDCLKGFLV